MSMRIEKWAISSRFVSCYTAPEASLCITGNVYGSDRFSDGVEISTSTVKTVSYKDDKLTVETKSGSIYELGVVHPDYEESYPDARNRLIESSLRVKEAHGE